jgi:dihydrodipicolinate synthase/N-acetylneuraminate lyase
LTLESKNHGQPSLRGVIPILPTPFTPDGAVDGDSFNQVIEAAIHSGVHGVAMFGLASEYYKLSEAERSYLVNRLVEQVAKRVPVVISIVPHSTRLAVAEAIQAVEAGADALMILPPFFLSPRTEAVLQHIHEIAEAVTLPIIVQYAPLQTGRIIDPQVFASLCQDFPQVTHVKVDLVPSGPFISALANYGVGSLVGYMGLHLPEDFVRGVQGVMPTVSVCPAFVEIWNLLAHDVDRARAVHRQILPLLNLMMQSIEGLIACEKELLLNSGWIRSNHRRDPTSHLDSIQKRELELYSLDLKQRLVQSR